MKTLASLGVVFSLLVATSPDALAGETAGGVSTEFKVTEQGAASINFPLSLPTARGGVKPEVSLTYNSNQLSQSVAGTGWLLSGLQQIQRCAPTPILDNSIGAVTNTSSYKLCLDGQRLHLVSGVYGAPGSDYRLDQQPGITISAHGGSQAKGPVYFKVHTKARDTMYLGNAGTHSGSSAAVAQTENGTRTQWLLSSVEDGVSNRIDYQYQVVSGSQTRRIDSIKYGAQLVSVTECAPNVNGINDCKKPVTFDWADDASSTAITQQRTFGALRAPSLVKSLDINGDGYTDLAYVKNGAWRNGGATTICGVQCNF